MLRQSLSRLAHAAAAALAVTFILVVSIATAPAQNAQGYGQQGYGQERYGQQAQGRPGQFDFYVLALSWSPSFCESASERNRTRGAEQQCGARPYAFVVHGLWPQYERGFPSNCQVPAPRLSRDIVNSMLDIMPSPRLVFHEWDQHGTCAGLNQRVYFDTIRKAHEKIKIPERYHDLAQPLMVSPGEVVGNFIAANAGSGLSADAMSIDCDYRRLREVRICMNKDLSFRSCNEVARRSCRADRLVMPPVRGPRAAEADETPRSR